MATHAAAMAAGAALDGKLSMHARWLWSLMLGVSPLAWAGTVHRCDDGSGVPIYQNAPCVAPLRSVAQYDYAPDPDAGKPPAAAAAAADRRAAAAPRERVRSARPEADPAAHAFAFECGAGPQRWLQSTPCPVASGTRAVAAKPLTRAALCARLRDRALRAGAGTRSSDDTYERNRLRAHGNC